MGHDMFCVAYRRNRWIVMHRGRDLGSFFFRARALRVAIEAAHWSASGSNAPNIYIHDRTGQFYTAWRGDRDSIVLSA
jgi:hypothetical protein